MWLCLASADLCSIIYLFFCTFMEASSNPKFGPAAQTPAQREWVVTQMHHALPNLKKQLNASAKALYARYVAGELSWQQMRQAMDVGAGS